MDSNDSKQPQQTGGLKLMTVFIAVLALHVLVIGGFTVYHLMSGGNDADVATIDKKHDNKPADVATATTTPATDTTTADKPTTTAPATDTTAASPTTPAPETVATEPTPAPAPTTVATTVPAPAAPTPAPEKPMAPAPAPTVEHAPAVAMVQPSAPLDLSSAMKSSSLLAPPLDLAAAPVEVNPPAPALTPEPAPALHAAPALSSATPSGPVHMPPTAVAPPLNHNDTQHHEIYTVKITDSWKKIAKAHRVTVASLKDVNHIKGDTLHTGQKLIIPGTSSRAIAKSEMEAPVKSDRAMLHTAVLTTTTASSSSPHTHYYTIEKGDTLGKIAHKFGTTKSALISANDISNPAKLTVGHKLKIPSRESRSAGNTVPVYTAPVPAPAPPRLATPVDMPPASAPAPASNITDAQGDLATFTP